jgi:hypothetical protein
MLVIVIVFEMDSNEMFRDGPTTSPEPNRKKRRTITKLNILQSLRDEKDLQHPPDDYVKQLATHFII